MSDIADRKEYSLGLYGLQVECVPLVVKSEEAVCIRLLCRYSPPVPGLIRVSILDSIHQSVKHEYAVSTELDKEQQRDLVVPLNGTLSADQYLVKATIEGTGVYSYGVFYVTDSSVSMEEQLIEESLRLRSDASDLMRLGDMSGAIKHLEQCGPGFVRSRWYDCAGYVYRDLAILKQRAGELSAARSFASKALLYSLTANYPIIVGEEWRSLLVSGAVESLVRILHPGYTGRMQPVDLYLYILRLLGTINRLIPDPLYLMLLEDAVKAFIGGPDALKLLSLVDVERAFKSLQLVTKTHESEFQRLVSPESLRVVLDRIGPRRAYRFIDEASTTLTEAEGRVIDLLADIYWIAFEESGGGDTVYIGRQNEAADTDMVPVSRDFVERVARGVGVATFKQVMQDVEVIGA